MATSSESESVFKPEVYEVFHEQNTNVIRSDQPVEHTEPSMNVAPHGTLRESGDNQHVVRDTHHQQNRDHDLFRCKSREHFISPLQRLARIRIIAYSNPQLVVPQILQNLHRSKRSVGCVQRALIQDSENAQVPQRHEVDSDSTHVMVSVIHFINSVQPYKLNLIE